MLNLDLVEEQNTQKLTQDAQKESNPNQVGLGQTVSEKIKLARTGLEPETCLQLILNPEFIKIVKRLYLKFFVLYILTVLSVFVLPENIGDNAACAGFVSLMEQFFKCRCGRD